MKKIFYYIIIAFYPAIISSVTAQPQSMNIIFNSRYYGHYIKPDSILIKNLNRGCDTIIFYPDTNLTLYYTVGIAKNKTNNQNTLKMSQNYPNPVLGNKTSFDLYVFDKTEVIFEVFNIIGEKIFSTNYLLKNNKYVFDFYPGKKGNFILRAKTENICKTIKVVSLSSENKPPKIKLNKIEANHLKATEQKNIFWFEPGDTLRFVGYAYTPHEVKGSDVTEKKPEVTTEFVTFHIIEGVPCHGNEAVKYAGQLYKTVQINNQCWLKENLNVGIMINGAENMTDNGIIEKYCYDNDSLNCNIFGGLYQWDELMQYTSEEGARGICPEGWHVATKAEWEDLIIQYNGNELKEQGTNHWAAGNNGNNISGFTAIAAGYKQYNHNTFEMLFEGADFYTSTQMPDYTWYVWFQSLFYSSSWVGGGDAYKTHGDSVRCIKDENK